MQRIALTGGIATGKTHVAGRLRLAGVPVVDADALARAAVAPGSPALADIVARFGAAMLTPDGTLDRARLGSIVFADAQARRDLEAIVHPPVRAAIEAFFAGLPEPTPFAVADIPLLYETDRAADFDRVIVVACTRDQQVDRVVARDRLPRDEAERRVASQWPIEDKVARADYLVRTDGSHAETDAQVAALLARLHRDAPRRDRPPA